MNRSWTSDVNSTEMFQETMISPHPSSRDAVYNSIKKTEEAVCFKVASENFINIIYRNF